MEEHRVDEQQQPRWRPTRRQLLWASVIAALAFLAIVICGYLFEWEWTGLHKRTFWDWLQLLIIPAVLAGGGLWFNRQQREQELQTADRRAQDEALQAYLEQMSQLLTDKERPLHRAQPGDDLSAVVRAWTLTVLLRLDGGRKKSVLEFLYESRLIDQERTLLESGLFERRHNIVKLELADLSRAYLSRAYLSRANLSGANLSEADLSEAKGSTKAQLLAADSLRGAIMPDGQMLKGPIVPDGPTFEDWLKSIGHGEDGENRRYWHGQRQLYTYRRRLADTAETSREYTVCHACARRTPSNNCSPASPIF
jgi:hypothetical protein